MWLSGKCTLIRVFRLFPKNLTADNDRPGNRWSGSGTSSYGAAGSGTGSYSQGSQRYQGGSSSGYQSGASTYANNANSGGYNSGNRGHGSNANSTAGSNRTPWSTGGQQNAPAAQWGSQQTGQAGGPHASGASQQQQQAQWQMQWQQWYAQQAQQQQVGALMLLM